MPDGTHCCQAEHAPQSADCHGLSSGLGLGLSIFAGCTVHVLQTYLGKQMQSTEVVIEVLCAGREWCYTGDGSCACHLCQQWTPHSIAGDLAQDPCSPGEPSSRSSCLYSICRMGNLFRATTHTSQQTLACCILSSHYMIADSVYYVCL